MDIGRFRYGLLVTTLMLTPFVDAGPISSTNVYPPQTEYSNTWTLDATCDITLSQDYSPYTDPSQFQVILHLEPHATGGITVYWPFEQASVVSDTSGGNTRITLTSQAGIYMNEGVQMLQFRIDFNNPDGTVDNWPTGHCSGPHEIGDAPSSTTAGYVYYGNFSTNVSVTTIAPPPPQPPPPPPPSTSSTDQPKCNNNNTVTCQNCQVGETCRSISSTYTLANAEDCFKECEHGVTCLGTQYSTASLTCMMIQDVEECRHLEYTDDERITVSRKSCRTDCESFILVDMSDSDLSFNLSNSYASNLTPNSEDCLNSCIESNDCSAALLDPSDNDSCSYFANCENAECMINETGANSGNKQQYLIQCIQAAGSGSTGGTVTNKAGGNVLTSGSVTSSSSTTSTESSVVSSSTSMTVSTPYDCSNKLGCYHCQLTADCTYYPVGFYSTQQDCYEICEAQNNCLGIQFDYTTEECRYFEDNGACHDVEFTPEERYVYRKSCRNDCAMIQLALTTTWTFTPSEAFGQITPDSEGDCLATCLDMNTCDAVLYDVSADGCYLFSNCASGCQVAAGSYTGDAYHLYCREECPILDDPFGGMVSLTGTMDGHVATYQCYASLQMVGNNQRTCVMGTWNGAEPTCESIPTGPATSLTLLTSSGTTSNIAVTGTTSNVATTASACSNRLGCYHCQVALACFTTSMGVYSNEEECLGICSAQANCLGLQFDYTTKECLCFEDTVSCHDVEYTPEERYVYRKSCRNDNLSVFLHRLYMYHDCSMFELGQLVNWSLNLSRAYDNSMQFSAADCIGNCLDATTCNGAVYDAATYECYRFASCGSTCLVASAVSDSYRLYCRQACPILDQPSGGMVSLSGTMHGHVATYECDATHQLSGSNQRTCLMGTWDGAEPTCEPIPIDCGVPDVNMDTIVGYSSTLQGHVASYHCNTGFTLVGNGTRVCEENGQWSSSAPVCVSNVMISSSIVTGLPLATTSSVQPSQVSPQSASMPSSTLDSTTSLPNGISTQSAQLTPTPPDPISTNTVLPSPVVDPSSFPAASIAPTPSPAMSLSVFSSQIAIGASVIPSLTAQVSLSASQSEHISVSQVASTSASTTSISPTTTSIPVTSISSTTTMIISTPALVSSAGSVTGLSAFTNGVAPSPVIASSIVLPAIGSTIQLMSATFVSPQSASFSSSIADIVSPSTVIVPSATISVVPSTGVTLTPFVGSTSGNPPTLTIPNSPGPISPVVGSTSGLTPSTSSAAVSATADSTPSSLLTPAPPRPIYLWPCLCSNRSFAGLSQDEIIEQLVNDVKIDTKATQLALSRKICKGDSRPSSAGVGALAVTFIATFAGLIVVLDLLGKVPLPCPCCTKVKT